MILQLEEPTLLRVLLNTWGTGNKATSYVQTGPPPRLQGDPDSSAEPSDEGALEFGDHHEAAVETSGPPSGIVEAATEASLKNAVEATPEAAEGRGEEDRNNELLCAEILQEAMKRPWLDPSRGNEDGIIDGAGQQTAHDGSVLATTDMAQILEAMPAATVAAWGKEGEIKRPFRALVVGGGGCGGGGGDSGGNAESGLEHEELLHVVSLLVQLSTFSNIPYFDVTYAHPNRSILEAAQALVASCPDQLGFSSGGSLRFEQSTLQQILDADTQERFDYVDIGGQPLTTLVEKRDEGGGREAVDDAVLDAKTLRRLGAKLSPGACLRVWTFAKNPFTDVMFQATTASYNTPSRQAKLPQTAASLGKYLRATFGMGRTPRFAETYTEEEVWVRQAHAGRNGMGVTELHEGLSAAGFELSLMLGDSARYDPEGTGDRKKQGLSDMAELLGGMSKWEVAALADALEPSPLLVHQALAIWQGSSAPSSSSQAMS